MPSEGPHLRHGLEQTGYMYGPRAATIEQETVIRRYNLGRASPSG